MSGTTETSAGSTAIRPFTIPVIPETELEALRTSIAATRWPDKEPVDDQSQGVQLATIRALARYWGTEYDWRKCEARLKALPQFVTEIDGLDIHFIHVRSEHDDALPLIVTHGWPGSIIELLKIIDPLTNPTAHGGSASDAFHLVIPSLPGYGFSGKPATTGWDPPRIARAWTVLMNRLGYTQFAAQGGDWGAMAADVMGARWLTNTAVSSARIYWENKFPFFAPKNVTIPVAVSAFPDEVVQTPRSWTERAYPNLIYYNKVDKGKRGNRHARQ